MTEPRDRDRYWLSRTKRYMEHVLNELYRVFQPYCLGPDFSGCSHCIDPADTERLANSELRSLTLRDLDSFSFNAMTTWGDVKHFKYFLPRLFEIASSEFNGFLSAEVLFGKLAYGKWDDWPETEHRAVDDFLHEFWKSIIASEIPSPDDDSIDTALCAIGKACTTIVPFLQQWTAPNAPVVPNQLAQFVLLNIQDIAEHRRLTNSFWDGRTIQAREVMEWGSGPICCRTGLQPVPSSCRKTGYKPVLQLELPN